jgi:hypothetical protein
MERFAEDVGVQVLTEVDLGTMTLGETRAAERRRIPGDLAAPWQPRDDRTTWMAGARLTGGITGELFTRLGADPEQRPLLDTLLMLAPALIQCMAAPLRRVARIRAGEPDPRRHGWHGRLLLHVAHRRRPATRTRSRGQLAAKAPLSDVVAAARRYGSNAVGCRGGSASRNPESR